ncbi:hypothetical protein E1264_13210 [Actinomadura sp. KC216]|uniref:hypothetical protein n=1 Tax=Actinomadura sp. KC216 TaxID=2530370 RepID=UPI0010510F23|nr:hypothetical protein [Actinomadura sp. KC216]TDB87917.1 hypothetical protein E1264_13210 [Actinomadura sp. KC216]
MGVLPARRMTPVEAVGCRGPQLAGEILGAFLAEVVPTALFVFAVLAMTSEAALHPCKAGHPRMNTCRNQTTPECWTGRDTWMR